MTRRYVPLLLTLSALWGASYLFIKVGVRDLAPTVLVELRLLLAAAVLVGFLWLREGGPGARAALRAAARPGIVLGLVNASIPFVLIAWGERHVDSGVAAVANATVPIFNALLALRFNRGDAVSGMRLLGVLAGLVGVAVLAGVDPRGGWWAVAGTLAVVLASLLYAGGGIYGQKRLSRAAGPALQLLQTAAGEIDGAKARVQADAILNHHRIVERDRIRRCEIAVHRGRAVGIGVTLLAAGCHRS